MPLRFGPQGLARGVLALGFGPGFRLWVSALGFGPGFRFWVSALGPAV